MKIDNLKFGVEIETTIPDSAPVMVGGYHRGVAVINGPKFQGAPWMAESDASIWTSNYSRRGCEFVSPILCGEEGIKHVLEFVGWLVSIGAQVNTSCGLHVHVGTGSFGFATTEELTAFISRIARIASRRSLALYAQTGTLSRENGHYCAKPGQEYKSAVRKIAKAKTVSEVAVNRYQLLNLCNVPTKGTVEFRCFAGTLNANKILLHLFSAFQCCTRAVQNSSTSSWDEEDDETTGTKAVERMLRKPCFKRQVDADIFRQHRDGMLAIGLEMAKQYDEAKAGQRRLPLNESVNS